MRKYKVGDSIEVLRTAPKEIKLKEFQQIVELQGNSSKPDFNYYLSIFSVLGLSESYLDRMDLTNLLITVKDFQRDFKPSGVMKRSITINGVKYNSYKKGEKFELKARLYADIETRMNLGGGSWIPFAMALIFKEEGLSDQENSLRVNIEKRYKTFSEELTMDVCLPYIVNISLSYLNNLQILSAK